MCMCGAFSRPLLIAVVYFRADSTSGPGPEAHRLRFSHKHREANTGPFQQCCAKVALQIARTPPRHSGPLNHPNHLCTHLHIITMIRSSSSSTPKFTWSRLPDRPTKVSQPLDQNTPRASRGSAGAQPVTSQTEY